MQALFKLRADDFKIDKGTKGPILTTSIKGMALIMFWSPNCETCKKLLPQFQYLPKTIAGVNFCVLNVNENQAILQMSNQTIAPIKYVPYIVLYVNGLPALLFDDTPDLDKLSEFVKYSIKLIESKRQFIEKGARVESDIPKFSLNKPYIDMHCENDVCYITAHSGNNFVSTSDSCAAQNQAYTAKYQQISKTEDANYKGH